MEDISHPHIEDIESNKNEKQNAEYIPVDTHFDVTNTEQNADIQLTYELYPNDPERLAKDLEALIDTTWPDEYA